MYALVVLAAAALPAVDYGWQYAADGELEYIIQIEPAALRVIEGGSIEPGDAQPGSAITSQIPPEILGVRRFRIQIGTGPLPREELRPGDVLDDVISTETAPEGDVPNSEDVEEAYPNDAAGGYFDYSGYLENAVIPAKERPVEFDPDSATVRLTGDESQHVEQGAEEDPNEENSNAGTPTGEPMEREESNASPSDEPSPSASGESPARPWWPLTATVMALFGSLSGNFYLGWIFFALHRRFRTLARNVGASSLEMGLDSRLEMQSMETTEGFSE